MIDTNVLLDAVIESRPQSKEACEVLRRCNGSGEFGMACGLSLKDVYYVLSKHYGKHAARVAIKQLMGLIVVTPVDAEVCERALMSDEPDFEDGLIRACAELNGADFIITRDVTGFSNSKVRSVTAAEYLQIAMANDSGYPW